MLLLTLTAASVAQGCDGGAAGEDAGESDSTVVDSAPPDVGDAAAPLPPIPRDADPCTDLEHWPLSRASERFDFVVHFRPGEESSADAVVREVERAWSTQVEGLGFRPPLADAGQCGADEAFDVFLWAGALGAYVGSVADNPDTAWDDQLTYLVVDPGADPLRPPVAHELNHACQAADSWSASPLVAEMTSTFVERTAADASNDPYARVLSDFQSHPEWSLDRNDGYETLYMYGAALYLDYVRDRFFAGDASFVADMWLRSRRSPGDDEPDFQDALDAILTEADSISYLESAVEFARWRWYTGTRDDGAHFVDGSSLPSAAMVAVAATVTTPTDVTVEVMALGSAYIALETGGPIEVTSFSADPAVDWVVQVVPGATAGSDGETLNLSTGPIRIDATAPRALIVTALPQPPEADPDLRTDDLHSARLSFAGP